MTVRLHEFVAESLVASGFAWVSFGQLWEKVAMFGRHACVSAY